MIIKVPIVTVSNEEEYYYYCCCKDLRCSTKGNSVEKVEQQIVQMIKSVLTPLDIDYLKELGWSYSGSVLENPKYTTYDLQDFLKANCPFTITESTHIFPVKIVSIPVGEQPVSDKVEDNVTIKPEWDKLPTSLMRIPHYALINDRPYRLISRSTVDALYASDIDEVTLSLESPYFYLDAVEISFEDYRKAGGIGICTLVTTYDRITASPRQKEESMDYMLQYHKENREELFEELCNGTPKGLELTDGDKYECIRNLLFCTVGKTYTVINGKLIGDRSIALDVTKQTVSHFFKKV